MKATVESTTEIVHFDALREARYEIERLRAAWTVGRCRRSASSATAWCGRGTTRT
jgi:hypothetical protein